MTPIYRPAVPAQGGSDGVGTHGRLGEQRRPANVAGVVGFYVPSVFPVIVFIDTILDSVLLDVEGAEREGVATAVDTHAAGIPEPAGIVHPYGERHVGLVLRQFAEQVPLRIDTDVFRPAVGPRKLLETVPALCQLVVAALGTGQHAALHKTVNTVAAFSKLIAEQVALLEYGRCSSQTDDLIEIVATVEGSVSLYQCAGQGDGAQTVAVEGIFANEFQPFVQDNLTKPLTLVETVYGQLPDSCRNLYRLQIGTVLKRSVAVVHDIAAAQTVEVLGQTYGT